MGGVERIAALPFTEKDELRRSQAELPPLGAHAAVEMEEVARIYSTSGTSGAPLYIPLTRTDLDDWRRIGAASYSRNGLKAGQRLATTFGAGPFVAGASGAGQAMKLINNMVLFQNVVALGEALALSKQCGLDPALAFEVLSKGSADSFALRHHGLKAMLPGDYPERAFSVDYARKDLGYALELARQAGLPLSGALNALAMLEKAAASGDAKKYFPVLAKVIGGT